MSAASGRTVGIQVQRLNGSELLLEGGESGLFIPESLRHGVRLLVVDGPADTAAALDLGFQAVGRPSGTGEVSNLADLIERLQAPEVVVVDDADQQRGHDVRRLLTRLAACCPAVRVITPPAGIRGIRNWAIRGAIAADVEAAINVAPVERL